MEEGEIHTASLIFLPPSPSRCLVSPGGGPISFVVQGSGLGLSGAATRKSLESRGPSA